MMWFPHFNPPPQLVTRHYSLVTCHYLLVTLTIHSSPITPKVMWFSHFSPPSQLIHSSLITRHYLLVTQVGFNFLNESVEVISAFFDVFDQPVVVYGQVAVNQAVSKIEKRFQ